MKKILLMIVPLMALIGCSYDDTDIQKRLDDLDGQLTELQALVKALCAAQKYYTHLHRKRQSAIMTTA